MLSRTRTSPKHNSPSPTIALPCPIRLSRTNIPWPTTSMPSLGELPFWVRFLTRLRSIFAPTTRINGAGFGVINAERLKICEAVVAENPIDDVVHNVDTAAREDAQRSTHAWPSAGIRHDVVPDDAAVSLHADAARPALSDAVVLDDMAAVCRGAANHRDSISEALNCAVANRDPGVSVVRHPGGSSPTAARRIVQHEAVAVDRDVIGIDLNRSAGGDTRHEILPQAPRSRFRDEVRRIDIADTIVVAAGRAGTGSRSGKRGERQRWNRQIQVSALDAGISTRHSRHRRCTQGQRLASSS